MNGKRYCLEKLTDYHRDTGTETWKRTNKCSDDLNTLEMFMSHTFRIVDTHTNREVRRNFDPRSW